MAAHLDQLSLEQLHALKHKLGHAGRSRVEAAIAGKANPGPPAQPSSTASPPNSEAEKEVQGKIYKRLTKLGVAVYWMSQARKTGQTPGVPDLMCFHPLRGLFFVEVKAAGGSQREAQRLFEDRCAEAGVPYVLGGLAEVEQFMRGEIDGHAA